MENFKITMIITGSVIVSTFAAALVFNDNEIGIDSVNKIQSSVRSNERNILQIKTLLQDLKKNNDSSTMNYFDISDVSQQVKSNNSEVRQLKKSFDSLSDSFLALNQKQETLVKLLTDKTSSTSNNQEKNILETATMPILPPTPNLQESRTLPQEAQWDATDLDDSVATTEIQDKLATAFLTENNDSSGVSVSNVECRTDICKVALEYPNDFEESPVMQLMQQGGFEGKEISIKEDQGSGDRTSMTIFITKVEETSTENNIFPESIPQN